MKLHDTFNGIDIYVNKGQYFVPLLSLQDINPELLSQIISVYQNDTDPKEIELEKNIQKISEIRSEYNFNPQNLHLNTFKQYRAEIYNVLAHRLGKNNIQEEGLRVAFQVLTYHDNISLLQFLVDCGLNYHMALMDFLWIVNKGVVSSPPKEAKAAKQLADWLKENKTSCNELVDCWNWFTNDTKKNQYYKRSLTSLVTLLPDYQNQIPKEESLEDLLKRTNLS